MNNLLQVIKAFEAKVLEALEFKYRGLSPKIRENLVEVSPVTKMDITQFYDLYLGQDAYPSERLEKLVYQLMDIKIELFYILELDLGLYNHLIYDEGFTQDNINDFPYVALRKLSLDQTIIMKSRILWERLMNFVYFLESGKTLEVKKSSKKARFFEFIPDTKWAYLGEYRDYIDWFDDKLRTPEIHKSSTLRKQFTTDATIPGEKIMALTEIVMNAFWPGLLAIIKGGEFRSRFWSVGMEVQ